MPAMLEMEGITEISDEMRAVVRSGGPNCCCRAGCRADRKRIGFLLVGYRTMARPDIQWIEPKNRSGVSFDGCRLRPDTRMGYPPV
jgi:hypothetical protein